MRSFFVILICKILKFIGSFIGRGSSLPGQIALKLDKNILSRIKLPPYIIAVTGSNGKTSTVEMIAHILTSGGKSIAYNKEGSNQIEGVTTLILSNCTLGGKMKKDILLIESDERYAKYTFKHFHPTHYVITNLYRDQLTRNGHPQWVYAAIKDSIYDDTKLILNADDPLVSLFGYGRDNNIWFGVDRFDGSGDTPVGMYRDGTFCPNCYSKMEYEYYHYNHIGSYHCKSCGHRKNKTDYTVTDVKLDKSEIVIDGESKITLALNSMYNVYNILAAYAVCDIAGIDKKDIVSSINNYVLKNGRVVNFSIGNHNGTLLTSKHENSVSYDQSIKLAASSGEEYSVLIIVDAISRKYFTSETSWLWDINFSALESNNLKSVILSGTYCNDLAVRFEYTDIPKEKIQIIESIEDAVNYFSENGNEKIYTITCFSDKDKFLCRVNTL